MSMPELSPAMIDLVEAFIEFTNSPGDADIPYFKPYIQHPITDGGVYDGSIEYLLEWLDRNYVVTPKATLDLLAEALDREHYTGNGCGDLGRSACLNCHGDRPSGHEVLKRIEEDRR